MKIVPGRMRANCSRPISPRVCGVSGTCTVTTSDVCSSSSSEAAGSALPSGSLLTTSWKRTSMPSASAITESCEPMLP